jgi:hypothetical protein
VARQLDVEIGWVRRAIAQKTQPQGGAKPARPEPVRSGPVANTPSAPEDQAPPEAPEPEIEKIVLKNAPKDEAFILSLLLHFENLMVDLLDAGPEELLPLFSHPGIKRLLHLAVSKYQANPQAFHELAPSLATVVDNPAIIAVALTVTVEDGAQEGFERRLMTDYLNAIRQRHLKQQAKALASQLKDGVSPEKLEAFMELQRNRLAKKRDS